MTYLSEWRKQTVSVENRSGGEVMVCVFLGSELRVSTFASTRGNSEIVKKVVSLVERPTIEGMNENKSTFASLESKRMKSRL